jgi:hypothetical protein
MNMSRDSGREAARCRPAGKRDCHPPRFLATLALLVVFVHSPLIETGRCSQRDSFTTRLDSSYAWKDTGGPAQTDEAFSLACDQRGNTVYALILHQGVWKYHGGKWSSTGGNVGERTPLCSIYDSNHGILYVGTSASGVWKYKAGAWSFAGLHNQDIDALYYHPRTNTLFAGGPSGVWTYKSGVWKNIGGSLSGYRVDAFAYDPINKILYAGYNNAGGGSPQGPSGVWKYQGGQWTSTGGQLKKYQIYCLEFDPDRGVLYAGCADPRQMRGKGVWKYQGGTWSSANKGWSIYVVSALVYNPVNKILYAGAGNGVWKYTSGSWKNTGGAVSQYWEYALVCDTTHQMLYAGCVQMGQGKGVWSAPAESP